jgi:hypothetical protein
MGKYLFILCSHSSGSTALWKLLQTSVNVSALPLEGQFIETVQPIMRASIWAEDKELPWAEIKAEWEKFWDTSKPVLVEKSPPNLLEAFEIQKWFPEACFIVMVRNPYAYCEGTKRRGRAGLGYGPAASYEEIAAGWIRETEYQIRNIKALDRVIQLTYEELTQQPDRIAKRILAFLPEIGKLDLDAPLMIHSLHGWFERPVTDLNAMQIARLTDQDIDEINRSLKLHPEVMSFFGYRYLNSAYNPLDRFMIGLSNLLMGYGVRNAQRLFRRARRLVAMFGFPN